MINELHLKIALKDHLGRRAASRAADDLARSAISCRGRADERADLAESDDTRWLLDELPDGVHLRPEGGGDSHIVLMLWAYHVEPREPIVPPPLDEFFPEVVRARHVDDDPRLAALTSAKRRCALYDGGYYTKTPENRPLAGPLPVEGAYVCGAVSGYGLMASAAVGELVAAHVTGNPLPDYAPAFSIERYNDPGYRRWLENWRPAGQL